MRPAVAYLARPVRVGQDRLDDLSDGPVIFVSNHHSHVDTPLLLTSVPLPWRRELVVGAAAVVEGAAAVVLGAEVVLPCCCVVAATVVFAASAVVVGDHVLSPLQCADPDWAGLDMDPAASPRLRRTLLAECAERGTLMIGPHFGSPGAGRVRARGNAWVLDAEHPGA